MLCERCGTETYVDETVHCADGTVWRYRQCPSSDCGMRVRTSETVDHVVRMPRARAA